MDRTVRIGSLIAQEIDQGQLHAALTRHPSGANQAQRLMQCRWFHARIENDLGDRSDIAGQSAMTNGIFGNELQMCGVAKIVCSFEDDPFTRQMRMLLQVSPQTCCIPCIEKIDGPTK